MIPGIATIQLAVAVLLLAGGVFFTVVSTIGLLRLPDVYTRSHLVTETDTLGAGLTLAAVAVALGWHPQTVLTVLLLTFIFITNPTAAHAIARAAYESGITPIGERGADTGATGTTGAADTTETDYAPDTGHTTRDGGDQ